MTVIPLTKALTVWLLSMTGTWRASLLGFHPRHSAGPRNGMDPQQGLWEGILRGGSSLDPAAPLLLRDLA